MTAKVDREHATRLLKRIAELSVAPADALRPALFIKVAQDNAVVGLSLRLHPVSFVREELCVRSITRNGELAEGRLCPDRAALLLQASCSSVSQRENPGQA